MEEFICPKCGNHLNKNAKYCSGCGSELDWNSTKNLYCSQCGSELKNGAKYCSDCGANTTNNQSNAQSVMADLGMGGFSAEVKSYSSGITVCNILGLIFIPKLFWIISLVKNSDLKRQLRNGGRQSDFIGHAKSLKTNYIVALILTIISFFGYIVAESYEMSSDTYAVYVMIMLVIATISISICAYAISGANKIINRSNY